MNLRAAWTIWDTSPGVFFLSLTPRHLELCFPLSTSVNFQKLAFEDQVGYFLSPQCVAPNGQSGLHTLHMSTLSEWQNPTSGNAIWGSDWQLRFSLSILTAQLSVLVALAPRLPSSLWRRHLFLGPQVYRDHS